jgi:hypothetical protein
MQSLRLSKSKAHPSARSGNKDLRFSWFLICFEVLLRPFFVSAIDHHGFDRFDHRSRRGLPCFLPPSYTLCLRIPMRFSAILGYTPNANSPLAFASMRSSDHTTSSV